MEHATRRWSLILGAVLVLYAALWVGHQFLGLKVLPW